MGKVESLRAMREAKYAARLRAHANHPAVVASAATRRGVAVPAAIAGAPAPVRHAPASLVAVPSAAAASGAEVVGLEAVVPAPVSLHREQRPDVEAGRPIARYRDDEIDQVVAWLLSDGVPRGDDTLVTEFMAELGFERRGKAIRARVAESLGRLRGSPQPQGCG